MHTCEYCNAALPGDAAFCGACGRVQSASKSPRSPGRPSQEFYADLLTASPPHANGPIDSFQTAQMSSPDLSQAAHPDAHTHLSSSFEDDPLASRKLETLRQQQVAFEPQLNFPLDEAPTRLDSAVVVQEEEEEERRRRAALLGLGGAAAGSAFAGQAPTGSAPFMQGTPQAGSAPAFPNSPQVGGPNPSASPDPNAFSYGGPYRAQPQAAAPPYAAPPVTPPYAHPPIGHVPPVGSPTTPPGPSPHRPPTPPNRGCILYGALLLIPLLILVSIFGLGITVFAPTLSLSGNTSVNAGEVLHVQGHSFLGNSTVLLSIDNGLAIQLAGLPNRHTATHAMALLASQSLLKASENALPAASTVKTDGTGTFSADIQVNPEWAPGRHEVHAKEEATPRSASLAFTINGQSDTLPTVGPGTPTPTTKSATATQTATATTTPGATATTTPGTTPTQTTGTGLSALSPNSLALGSLNQGSSQALTGQTTLSASGNALISWNASWNTQQASWLQLDPSNGQIAAPGTQLVTVSAKASQLQPGTYSATVTFASLQSTQTQTLTVSFTVQGTCLKVAPTKLSFSTSVGATDPAAQSVTLSHCGATTAWSGTATTDSGGSWLALNPTQGNLNAQGSQTVSVAVSAQKNQLPAGTYTGTATFSAGTNQFAVAVTLVVQDQPTVQVTPTTISIAQCTPGDGVDQYQCAATLSLVNTQQTVDWSSVGSRATLDRASPASGTISPGQPLTISLAIYRFACPGSTSTLFFKGPNNTAAILITC